MSSSNSSTISQGDGSGQLLFVTYYPLTLIIVGTLFNFFTCIILCRPTFQDTNKRPILHYMRAVTIFDILMLYTWNLDHYLSGAFGFTLNQDTVVSCKITSFLNYVAPQVSAWLRIFICLDRYLSLSRLHKTWFSKSKHVLIVIAGIIIIFTLINLHLPIFACFYNTDGTVNVNSRLYVVSPMWDYVNLGLYNCVPFIFMVIFNSGVIYHLIRLRQTSTVQNSRIQHRSLSITLVVTTFLFLMMTVPGTVAYAFFSETASDFVLHFCDCFLFTYHVTSFLLYMITFAEFRKEVIRLVTCNRWHKVQPLPMGLTTLKTINDH
jgi:hypothetical protein